FPLRPSDALHLPVVIPVERGRELRLTWRGNWKLALQISWCFATGRCNFWTKIRVRSNAVAVRHCPLLICEDVQWHLRCTAHVGGKAAAGIRLQTRCKPSRCREFQLTGSENSATHCGRHTCARPKRRCY